MSHLNRRYDQVWNADNLEDLHPKTSLEMGLNLGVNYLLTDTLTQVDRRFSTQLTLYDVKS